MSHTTSIRSAALLVLASTAASLLSACASTPMPKEQMAVAEASVKHASTTSTSDNAAGPLQIAVSKLDAARAAVAAKNYAQAKKLAEQADVDAQVAELHAQSVRSGKAAQESQDAERVLREELNRKTTTR